MTSYESACLLISLLSQYGIDANITTGGVKIYYKRHQRKAMTDILNGMGNVLNFVEVFVYQDKIKSKRPIAMYVVRHESKPISVSHNRDW